MPTAPNQQNRFEQDLKNGWNTGEGSSQHATIIKVINMPLLTSITSSMSTQTDTSYTLISDQNSNDI